MVTEILGTRKMFAVPSAYLLVFRLCGLSLETDEECSPARVCLVTFLCVLLLAHIAADRSRIDITLFEPNIWWNHIAVSASE